MYNGTFKFYISMLGGCLSKMLTLLMLRRGLGVSAKMATVLTLGWEGLGPGEKQSKLINMVNVNVFHELWT